MQSLSGKYALSIALILLLTGQGWSQPSDEPLRKLNTYLKTFDDGFYGQVELKGDTLYQWFKNGKFCKVNKKDIEGAVRRTSDVVLKCKEDGKYIFSSWYDEYTNVILYSSNSIWNKEELKTLLDNFLNSITEKNKLTPTSTVTTTEAKYSSPVIEAFKNAVINKESFDMNSPQYKDFYSLKKPNSDGHYGLYYNRITPKGNVFLFRTSSVQRDPHLVLYTGFDTHLQKVKSYSSSSIINGIYALSREDSADYAVVDSIKFRFDLYSVQVPLVHIEELRNKPFPEILLTLAYSEKFHLRNIMRAETPAYKNAWNYGAEGLLIKGLPYNFNSNGSFFQTIEEGFEDEKKAIAKAKSYAVKIEEALKGISYTASECDGKSSEKCYELMGLADNEFRGNYTYAYVKTFTVAAPAGTVFFSTKQKNLFTIRIYVETEENTSGIEILAE